MTASPQFTNRLMTKGAMPGGDTQYVIGSTGDVIYVGITREGRRPSRLYISREQFRRVWPTV